MAQNIAWTVMGFLFIAALVIGAARAWEGITGLHVPLEAIWATSLAIMGFLYWKSVKR